MADRDEEGTAAGETSVPLPRVPAQRNPWGVELLDLRPLTGTLTATSADRLVAENAVSFRNEDGRAFLRAARPEGPLTAANLRYPTEAPLADGVLFNPPDMDHKWALYVLEGRLVVVRSWQRKVTAVADVRQEADHVVVGPIRGAFGSRTDAGYTVCALDFLLRTHALGEAWPVPELAPPDEAEHAEFAVRNFTNWGRRAAVAAAAPFPFLPPRGRLRTNSHLHIAAVRGDLPGIAAELRAGRPADLRATDGLTPLQWALGGRRLDVLELLCDLGAAVDARSDEGATALMNAAQGDWAEALAWLLARGADPNAADNRGFTALHRVAELGRTDYTRMLLAAGANPAAEAQGHTARSLAAARGHTEIVALVAGAGAAGRGPA